MNEQQIKMVATTGAPKSLFLDQDAFVQVQRACKALAYSDLVPDMYKVSAKNPENKAIANCMIALDMANRMGADPLMVMQNMYIVYGRPGWSSAFLIATVNSCGRFKPLKFQHGEDGTVEIGEKTMPNLTCYAYTTEKDDEAELRGATISLAMAKAEGWATKNGSKWQTMPHQMLKYRAAAFWVRTYAPEVSMGFYTGEENEDMGNVRDVAAVDVTPAPTTNAAQLVQQTLARVQQAADADVEQPKEEKATIKNYDEEAENFFKNL